HRDAVPRSEQPQDRTHARLPGKTRRLRPPSRCPLGPAPLRPGPIDRVRRRILRRHVGRVPGGLPPPSGPSPAAGPSAGATPTAPALGPLNGRSFPAPNGNGVFTTRLRPLLRLDSLPTPPLRARLPSPPG